MSTRSSSVPRFTAQVHCTAVGERVVIYDADFGYDAALALTGDFLPEHALRYAEAVCAALNGAPIPVAPEDYGAAVAGIAQHTNGVESRAPIDAPTDVGSSDFHAEMSPTARALLDRHRGAIETVQMQAREFAQDVKLTLDGVSNAALRASVRKA